MSNDVTFTCSKEELQLIIAKAMADRATDAALSRQNIDLQEEVEHWKKQALDRLSVVELMQKQRHSLRKELEQTVVLVNKQYDELRRLTVECKQANDVIEALVEAIVGVAGYRFFDYAADTFTRSQLNQHFGPPLARAREALVGPRALPTPPDAPKTRQEPS